MLPERGKEATASGGSATLGRVMAITELGNGACLVLAAGVAGVVDAVAGGGGVIQLPALFLFLPPTDAAVVAVVRNHVLDGL